MTSFIAPFYLASFVFVGKTEAMLLGRWHFADLSVLLPGLRYIVFFIFTPRHQESFENILCLSLGN